MEIMRVKQQDGTIVDIPIGIGMTENEVDQKIIEAKSEVMNVINSDFATKDYVEQEIATFDFIKVVNILPETGLENRFYMVPKDDTQTQDLFDEYVWINKGTEEEPSWGWEWVTTKQIEVDLTPYATNDSMAEQIESAKDYADTVATNALQKAYPIGSIYLTMNTSNPADLFGFGTWTMLSNNFLIGAGDTYNIGATGGETAHTLVYEELPATSGSIVMHNAANGTNIAGTGGCFTSSSVNQGTYRHGGTLLEASTVSVGRIDYSNGGEDQPHNNMPPYLAVYMWKRVS